MRAIQAQMAPMAVYFLFSKSCLAAFSNVFSVAALQIAYLEYMLITGLVLAFDLLRANQFSAKMTHFYKIRTILVCILLAGLTLVVYWHVQSDDFVNFDDSEYVYENRHVQNGLTAKSVIWAFTTSHVANWHPVTWLSHMLDCQFFGLNAGLHHLTNLVFHIINTLSLLVILQKMTGDFWQSSCKRSQGTAPAALPGT